MRYTHTILILITLAGACENKTYPVDEEIEAHTEALLGTEVEGVTISFMLEHDGDLDDATKIALATTTLVPRRIDQKSVEHYLPLSRFCSHLRNSSP